MANPVLGQKFSPEDYLVWEELQPTRHEYVDGEVFDLHRDTEGMAGAKEQHVTVSGNAYMALRQHLAGTPCRSFMAEMKLEVQAVNSFHYPDVMVTCSEADKADKLIKREPTLIIEVLSPSTAAYDRGDKFEAYRMLPSLAEYVLIDTDKRTAEVYRKGADGLWVLHPFGKGQDVRWASVDLTVTAAVLFAEIDD